MLSTEKDQFSKCKEKNEYWCLKNQTLRSKCFFYILFSIYLGDYFLSYFIFYLICPVARQMLIVTGLSKRLFNDLLTGKLVLEQCSSCRTFKVKHYMQIISVLIYVQYKYKLVSLIEFKGFIVVLYFFLCLLSS